MSQRAAAIDIGSNSLLLTVAELGKQSPIPLEILHDEANVTGLSKGLAKDGVITEQAFERSAPVLKKYRGIIQDLQATHVKTTATEVLRRAKNGDEVRKRIEAILEHPVELISGDREAELSFWSVQKELNDGRPKLVFDIGGASTELCLGSYLGIEKRVSLKVGSVLLTEMYKLQNFCDPKPAIDYVRTLIHDIPWTTPPPACTGFGVAGTMTTLVAMELKLDRYDRTSVHGLSISRERLKNWLKFVCSRKTDDRIVPGLTVKRADVISGGFSIAFALAEHFGWNEITCMDSGIRFGVLYELLGI